MRWGRLAAASAVLGSAVVAAGAGPLASAGEGACASPYPPVYSVEVSGGQAPGDPSIETQTRPSTPVVAPDLSGGSVEPISSVTGTDMDGDGKVDPVEVISPPGAPSALVVHRGDGDLVLTDPQLELFDPAIEVGDLDGDGHDELVAAAGPMAKATMFIVAGTTAPGTHAVADVGVRLPFDPFSHVDVPTVRLGDQVGAPGDDVFVNRADGRGGLVDGADLLAPGPGGPLASIPIAVEIPDVVDPWTFDLGADGRALVGRQGGDLVVWSRGKATAYDPGRFDRVSIGTSTSGARYLVAATDLDRSGSGRRDLFDLDDPCAVLPAATSAAPAPAAPVPGTAGYTG